MTAGNCPDRSKTVNLRPFLENDIQTLLGWFEGGGEKDVLIWSGRNFHYPLDEKQIKKFLDNAFLGGNDHFFIIEAEKKAVGVIALLRINHIDRSGRIGFVLVGDQNMRRHGIAAQAVDAVLRVGFRDEKLHKITLGVFTFNHAAIRCYTRAGFHVDGMLRDQFAMGGGEYYNLLEMSILEDEWKTGNANPEGMYQTERLVLRRFTPADAEGAARFYRDNREFYRIWGPQRPEEFYTPDGQLELLYREADNERHNLSMRLWITAGPDVAKNKHVNGKQVNKKQTFYNNDNAVTDYIRPGTILGNMGLSQIVYGNFRSAFLGYQMDHRYTNLGFMTEALKELLRIAFNEKELHRIEANIMPANKASRAVAGKLGFREEGCARRYLKINGAWEDHIHYVLLKEEWKMG